MPGTLHLAQSMMHGQTRVRISMGNLKELKVPIPPLELQERFSRASGTIRQLQSRIEASRNKSQSLFNVLVQRAFRGEL